VPEQPGAVIDRMLAEWVTPVLVASGFRRRGRTYRRPAPLWAEVVTAQAERWNTAEGGGFRLTLGMFHPDTHRAVWCEEPPELPLESHCQVRLTLGALGDGGRPRRRPRDEWFRWELDTDLDALGERVAASVTDRVLPFLRAHRDWLDLRRLGRGRYPGESEQTGAALAWFAGDTPLARRELSRVARHGPSARREAFEVAGRLGLPFPAPEDEERLLLTVVPADAATVDEVRRDADSLWRDLVELLGDDPVDYVHGGVHPAARPWIELFGPDAAVLRGRVAALLDARRPHLAEVRTEVRPEVVPRASP
jgi:hypothetical protein